ncbi:hypothetical protein ACSBR2_032502 [Camellia fascicularis]
MNLTKSDLLSILPIPKGKLTVNYLLFPLISYKLKAAECKQLNKRMMNRINSWTTKFLSYGGRLQLDQSVLFSSI